MARSVVTRREPTNPAVVEALKAVHDAWAAQVVAEARWRDARHELDRAEARVREAEFQYERACRG